MERETGAVPSNPPLAIELMSFVGPQALQPMDHDIGNLLCLREYIQAPVCTSTLANRVDLETKVFECLVVQDPATIEHAGWLHHLCIELVIRIRLELVPLRQHDECMRTFHSLQGAVAEMEPVLVNCHVVVLELGHRVLFT